jgi:hypothetical protein
MMPARAQGPAHAAGEGSGSSSGKLVMETAGTSKCNVRMAPSCLPYQMSSFSSLA